MSLAKRKAGSVGFASGMLCGLACSSGSGVADAMADTVATVVHAAEVILDDASAALDADNVEDALLLLESRLASAESRGADTEARLAELETLAATPVSGLEVKVSVPGIDATTVDAALAESHAVAVEGLSASKAQAAQIEQLMARLATVESELAAATSCPDNMHRAGSTCMELQPHKATDFFGASLGCGNLGARLCFPSEFTAACNVVDGLNTSDQLEYSALIEEAGFRLVRTGLGLCRVENDPVQPLGDATLYPYRCCFDRINLVPGDPPP